MSDDVVERCAEVIEPGALVTVTAYGLNYSGRVTQRIHTVGRIVYHVEFACDGQIHSRDFFADEIKESSDDA